MKFWCLQTLVDLVKRGHAKSEPLSSPDEQTTFRTALIAWVQAQGAPTREEAPFVKNKFAQLVVAVIARDYPQMWPHAFTQLLDVLQCGPGSIDMFLRVLNAVHEEVICSDGGGYNPHLASKIKDAMREQCLPQITDAWFSILQLHESAPGLVVSCLNTMHLYVNWMDIALLSHPRFVGLLLPFMRQPQLHDGACLCLGEIVLKRMEAPAKLQHIERLELVGALSEAATAVPPAPSSPSHTLPSTVTTQLPSTRTLLLLHHHHHPSSRRRRAQVTTLRERFPFRVPQGVQLSTRFGSLVSTLALELLDCWDRLSTRTTPAADSGPMASKASELLRRAMPMLLSCLAADELVVSACTLSFLHSYVGRLRKLVRSPAELAEHEPHLQHLLIALARKSLYPDDFDFENEDEPEELFNAFRREGATLFKGVARVHPSLAQEFVRATLQATLAALPDVPWTHLEVALFLLFQLGEGLPEASVRDKSGVFQHMMTALLSSPASAHPHQGVQLLFFETAVRYYRFFLANPTFLPVALACFLDGRGLHNQQPRVRSRCCYLLLRFAKLTLKSTDAASLEGIIGALVDVLSQPPSEQLEQDVRLLRLGVPGATPQRLQHRESPLAEGGAQNFNAASGGGVEALPRLNEAEQLHLYETCGVLLGGGTTAPETTVRWLSAIFEQPLVQLRRLCAPGLMSPRTSQPSGSDEALQQLLTTRAAAVAFHISVVAVVSKGFGNLADEVGRSLDVRTLFSRVMHEALGALPHYGNFVEVRTKTLVLLHRMVETLGEDLAPFLSSSLPELLAGADPKEVQELVALLNQLVLRFKGKLAVPMEHLIHPLTTAIFTHIAALDAAVAAAGADADANAPQSDDVRERHALLRSLSSFVHTLVHNELTSVLASASNSANVEPMLRLLQQGCVAGPDLQLQRQCFLVLQRLVEDWARAEPGSLTAFDQYVLQDMLPVCFHALSQPHFELKNAAAIQVLDAIAGLQKTLLAKFGDQFVSYLRDRHLPSLGCSTELCAEYALVLCQREESDLRDFLGSLLRRSKTS